MIGIRHHTPRNVPREPFARKRILLPLPASGLPLLLTRERSCALHSAMFRSRRLFRLPSALAALLLFSVSIIASFSASAGVSATTSASAEIAYDRSRGGGVFGPSVAVDPGFAYYSARPLSETFRRIRAAGFTAVHVIDTGTTLSRPGMMREMVEASLAAGLAPVLRFHPPTDLDLYGKHPEWRQRMLGGADGRYDWRVYLCLNRQPFVEAYAAMVERKLGELPWAGVQFAELWLEQWGGPRDGDAPRAGYACVCDECVERFRALAGVDARDMLTSLSSPLWFERADNEELYRKWVEFRVETVVRFGEAIAAAARRGNPRANLDLMLLSDVRVEAGRVREYQAVDMERLMEAMKPDTVSIQDAWQDWVLKDLDPAFIADYGRSYAERLRRGNPDLFLFSHADVGSLPASRRSPDWIRRFAQETLRAGFNAPLFYEWSVSRLARP